MEKESVLHETIPFNLLSNFIVDNESNANSIKSLAKSVQYDHWLDGWGCAWYTGEIQRVIEELEKRFGICAEKPEIIGLFNADSSGRKKSEDFVFELRKSGYPTAVDFFEEGITAYDLLQKTYAKNSVERKEHGLLNELDSFLFNSILHNEDLLYTQHESLRKQAEEKAKLEESAMQRALNKSGIRFSSFEDYFNADFYSDLSMTKKYASRKTGFENIDASAQVFMPGLYVLGALPATGKTTFVWQLLNQLAQRGEECIFCSYEMSRAELYSKSIARRLFNQYGERAPSSGAIRSGGGGEEELKKVLSELANLKLPLKVAELSNMGIFELIETLKPLVTKTDRSSVVCVDYLQIVPIKDVRLSSTKEKIDDVILRLKNFQRETNSTVIVISSFNRENYFKPASFSSFKESGAIEYSADVIWALSLHDEKSKKDGTIDAEKFQELSRAKERPIKFSCLKNRNGSPYECFFKYYAAHDCFKPSKENEKRQICAQ